MSREVQGGDRFVADDEPRVERESTGDGDPLTLPSGELAGQAPGRVHRKVDPLEEVSDAAAGIAGIDALADKRFGQDVADGQ